jgi:signal peptidase I
MLPTLQTGDRILVSNQRQGNLSVLVMGWEKFPDQVEANRKEFGVVNIP